MNWFCPIDRVSHDGGMHCSPQFGGQTLGQQVQINKQGQDFPPMGGGGVEVDPLHGPQNVRVPHRLSRHL